jgi:SAM-dependent methyltransferase
MEKTLIKSAALVEAPLEKPVKSDVLEWDNYDNNAFYETVKAEGLQKLAEAAGLADGCDVLHLKPYWSEAESILEVGGGYGRVVKTLLQNGYYGRLTVVERCQNLFEYLKKKFNGQKNVELLQIDVHKLSEISSSFDLILFLWGAISDFTPEEQASVIMGLKDLLKPNGRLVVDTLASHMIPLGSEVCGRRFYSLEVDSSVIHVHLPSDEEIRKYADFSGFSKIERIEYETLIKRTRFLYLLS